MAEKEKYIINCDVCDARNVTESALEGYGQIVINADAVVLNEKSREILNRYPVTMNVDQTLDLEGDFEIKICNGHTEIKGSDGPEGNPLLLANGVLKIAEGSEEAIKKYRKILVNGRLFYPESASGYLGRISVNGYARCYPDGCVFLDDRYTMDRFFPFRAKENGRYFAARKIVMVDEEIDVALLKEKKVQFFTEKAFVPESKMMDAFACFGEEVKITVVPEGYAYVSGDTVLREEILRKYGPKLFIDGSLSLDADSTPLIGRLEAVTVTEKVELLEEQVEAFSAIPSEYQEMLILKGTVIRNKMNVTVDDALMKSSPKGISIINCVGIQIAEDVSPEDIREKLKIENCPRVHCCPQQKSSVVLVSENVAGISCEKEEKRTMEVGDMVKSFFGNKVINADFYVL